MRQTLDQQRAQYAWEQVSQVAPNLIKDYTREAKGAPALIMGSGLMQTLAFFQAKGKNQHLALLSHLCRWLGRTLGGTAVTDRERFPPEAAANFATVMAALHTAPSSLYLRATDEALALLRWIRQFADARKSMEG
ncbi:type III-B CRISPR module-associated protein Cmr5 [Tepidimonas charontis]|uniref:CRISPR type III-B/RAMP module-associated protein Cmr5 n=1 Tax=Tepidimonas charontis TaxID=2267262 RepID=A0A554X3R1_9BURK|nr:type III-B CRISPR module-associated protein Cmr5 [Tepidimonas charontis]TSE30396.1 CRISPR type III-B/RAMP module-associated protein Cmr5 [Tepidimonas charontis]